MLDCVLLIAFLFYFFHVGTLARERGKSPGKYQVLLFVLWFAGWAGAFLIGTMTVSILGHVAELERVTYVSLISLVGPAVAAIAVDVSVKQTRKRPVFNGIRLPNCSN
jgi:hypothetical protein